MRPRRRRTRTETRDFSLVSAAVPVVAPARATSSSTLSGWWPEAEVASWAALRAAPSKESRTSRRPYPAQSPGSSSSLIEDSRISSRISYSVWRPRVSALSTSRRD